HGLPAELSAGGVDISTQAPPHGGGDAVGFQPFLKGPDPAGGLVGALHHVVQGNQIHVARHPPELPGDQVRLPVVVVDPVDHGVLKGDAAAGLVEVVVAGPEQLLHVIGPVDGHDLGSGLAVRRMEGHRESQLKFKLR
ncbi:N-acetyltransferase domain-containing protein, partial [Dysosmobacter welbionis]